MRATTAEPLPAIRSDPPETALTRALNAEFTQPLAFVALAVAYVLSRAPFINIGYGTDPDAWRVALSGYWFWDHHEFYPSRLPGYPIPEYANAAVIKGGWLATNSLTVAISLLGLWFFASIAQRLDLPNRGLLVAGFAFTPLLWINSMTTMDYMWALTFILGSYYFLIGRDAALAGIFLGLAVGSRMTSAAMLVPFVAYMWRDDRRGEIRTLIVGMLFVVILAWAPIYWRYGPRMFNFYDSDVWYLNVLRLLAKDTLGLVGSLAVLVAAALSLPRLARLPSDFVRDKQVMVWVLAIGVTLIVFLRLPHESAYLIPLYPFGFFLMARYFRQLVFAGAVAAIIFAGFVDLTTPGEEITLSEMKDARIGRGLVLSNRETMLKQIDFADDIKTQPQVQPNTVISLGFVYPMFAVLNRDDYAIGILEKDKGSISQLSDKGKAEDLERGITFVWLLDWDDFQKYRAEGKQFAHTMDAGRSTAGLYGYRPALFGSQVIDLGRGPSGGSGAARTDR
jgi:hypothetical protein